MSEEGFLVDADTIEYIRADRRRNEGRMQPRPKVSRRGFDNGQPVPMVVTEVTSDYNLPQVGLGELLAVDSSFLYASQPVFLAKPYIAPDNVSGLIDPVTLQGVDSVYVSPRMINGVIFTGQLFLMQGAGQYISTIPTDYTPVGDVVCGSSGAEYVGLVTTDIRTTANQVYVDIDVSEFVKYYPTTATRATCRVLAYNATGQRLRNGQQVYLRHLANSKTNEQINRWRIVDYTCNISSNT